MLNTTYLIIEVNKDKGTIVQQAINKEDALRMIDILKQNGDWKGAQSEYIYVPVYVSSMRFTTPSQVVAKGE